MTAASDDKPHGRIVYWGFIILMAALVVVFVFLGTWQLQRLAEKEALVVRVETRLDQPPLALTEEADWQDVDALEYRPVTVTGTFRHDQTIRVFTSLAASQAQGAASGPGYWWVTPLVLDSGDAVLVNRGFVPEGVESVDVGTPAGVVRVDGLARRSDGAGWFTPEANAAERIEWVRDIERLSRLLDPDLLPVVPITIDQSASAEGFPQAGETVITFPNNHLGYAFTWYGFALLTPIMLGFWILRQRRGSGAPGRAPV